MAAWLIEHGYDEQMGARPMARIIQEHIKKPLADENGVAWNDPAVDADWGLTDPILSARDQANPLRTELDPMFQPHYQLRP